MKVVEQHPDGAAWEVLRMAEIHGAGAGPEWPACPVLGVIALSVELLEAANDESAWVPDAQ